MCGIAGSWGPCTNLSRVGEEMASSLYHRGPDYGDLWIDQDSSLVLAHRRLAVIDLSPSGRQPMVSPCGRFVLVYNGELYNHHEMRKELQDQHGAFAWQGYSDTETLLAALRHWGVRKALTIANGMFAFALWDRSDRTLTLGRDRLGEKPLYYSSSGGTFIFASQLQALTLHPAFRQEIDREALALYLRYNNVPGPMCIYRGICKLLPAHFLVIRNAGRDVGDPVCYWSLPDVAKNGIANRRTVDAVQLVNELDMLLCDAVGRRMEADVPLGAFLSGGFDSTMVVAQMQAQSSSPVKTFSIGSANSEYDESVHAAAVARHLGTDHEELHVTPADAQAVIPLLAAIFDEPFADSSQIPTYLVSKMARQKVTVALSGDGGDELFGGYNRHVTGPAVWKAVTCIPPFLRGSLGQLFSRMAGLDLNKRRNLLPEFLRVPGVHLKLEKVADAMTAPDAVGFYKSLCSQWKNPLSVVLGAAGEEPSLVEDQLLFGLPGLREQMMLLDMLTYLPGDILTKVDRASMAVSLEARVPFLDHRLVEFAWRIPTEFKVRDGQGKWLLRQVLDRYVPRAIMERPKQGFGVPIEEWLRGPLRDWAECLLAEHRLQEEGFFDPVPIRQTWLAFLGGRGHTQHLLWCILMFQAWWEEQSKPRPAIIAGL